MKMSCNYQSRKILYDKTNPKFYNLKLPKIIDKNQQKNTVIETTSQNLPHLTISISYMFMTSVISIYYLNTFYALLSYEVCL